MDNIPNYPLLNPVMWICPECDNHSFILICGDRHKSKYPIALICSHCGEPMPGKILMEDGNEPKMEE